MESFTATIEYKSIQLSRKTTYRVQHIVSPIPADMVEWAKDQKLVGWVTVAGEIPVIPSSPSHFYICLPSLIHSARSYQKD